MKIVYLLAVLMSLLSINCSNNALIKTTTGKSIIGEVIGASDSNVYIKTFARAKPINKNEIYLIDHPGNGLAVTGGIIGAYGLLNIAIGLPQCSDYDASFCIGVLLPAAIGIPMFVKGLTIWKKSNSNLLKPYSELSTLYILPNYTYINNESQFKLNVVTQF